MNDREMLLALEKSEGGPTNAGRAIGVSPQVWNGYKVRGMSTEGHLRVWLALNARRVLARWLKARSAQSTERAAA